MDPMDDFAQFPYQRTVADSSADITTSPTIKTKFYRHRWLKSLPGGRNTEEIVGTAGMGIHKGYEYEVKNNTLPRSEVTGVDQSPASGCIKMKNDFATESKSALLKPGTPYLNGKDRKLIPWHGDRMAEKLLLCIQYECYKAGINVPYEEAIQRLQPGSGGYNAMKQQFTKWRDQLVAEGHMIPPPLMTQRESGGYKKVRGLVRDMTSSNPTATKELLWTNEWIHRTKSLDIPGVVRGSGNYKRQKKCRVNTELVGKSSLDARGNIEPLPKRQRSARSSVTRSAQRTKLDPKPDSDSDYSPVVKREAGSIKPPRKSCRNRGYKIQNKDVDQDQEVKSDGALVTVKDGMAVMHLPSDVLRALSPDVHSNNLQTPTRQVIGQYPEFEFGTDQSQGFVNHNYESLSTPSPLMGVSHACGASTDPFLANTDTFGTVNGQFPGVISNGTIFDNSDFGRSCSLIPSVTTGVYSTGYNFNNGGSMRYNDDTRHGKSRLLFIDGITYLDGLPLDLDIFDHETSSQVP